MRQIVAYSLRSSEIKLVAGIAQDGAAAGAAVPARTEASPDGSKLIFLMGFLCVVIG